MLTTYLDDGSGARYYLDFESGDWLEFPEDWQDQIARVRVEGDLRTAVAFDEHDDSLFRDSQVTHPVTGERLECVIEEGERLYFDVGAGQWAAMPVSLEMLVPEVQAAIHGIQAQVEGWRSSREIVLALRAHGYNPRLVVEERQYEEQAGLVQGGADRSKPVSIRVSGLVALELPEDTDCPAGRSRPR